MAVSFMLSIENKPFMLNDIMLNVTNLSGINLQWYNNFLGVINSFFPGREANP